MGSQDEARLAGRVPAAAVEGYVRAGAGVYDDLAAAEALHHAAADPGYDIAAETRLAGAMLVAAGLLTRHPAPPPRAVMRPVLPH